MNFGFLNVIFRCITLKMSTYKSENLFVQITYAQQALTKVI